MFALIQITAASDPWHGLYSSWWLFCYDLAVPCVWLITAAHSYQILRFLHPNHPPMTFLLMTAVWCRLPSSCTSAPSSPYPSKGKPREGIQIKPWETQGGGESLRFNSSKLICQQNLITVIYGKSVIVLPRQAHPCPTLFCYQNIFPWSHHLLPNAGPSQPFPVHLGRGREPEGPRIPIPN